MKTPFITLTATAVLGAAVLGGCGDDGDTGEPVQQPTCIAWTSSPATSPSATTSAPAAPGPTGCVTDHAVGDADGGSGGDVPDCDAEDMLTGDKDCAYVLPGAKPTSTPSPSPKKSPRKTK